MESRSLSGMKGLMNLYQAFFIDLWGVVHDGVALYPDAIGVLKELQKAQKKVVLLSNAPRRSAVVKKFLASLGIKGDLFSDVVTSGEDMWASLQEKKNSLSSLVEIGSAYFMGSPQDLSLLHECGFSKEERLQEASFILATGFGCLGDALTKYQDQLDEGLRLNLPLICVNPDKVVHVGGAEYLCAGTLADYYEMRGGRVFYHGKPHRSVYERAHKLVGRMPKKGILAIGDSFHTDVQGACHFGIDVALVMGGIHKKDLLDEHNKERDHVGRFLKTQEFSPTYHMPFFAL